MSIATQEVRRNRLVIALLAVCLSLAAILQLNGRSVFAIGEAQGKNGAFATLVQPDPKGVAGGVAPATGPVGRWLDSASRSFGNPRPRAVAAAPADAAPAGAAASSGTVSQLAAADTPSTVPAASAGSDGGAAGGGSGGGGTPFSGLFSPGSGPGGFLPNPTPTPAPPTASPTPEPSGTPPVNPTPTPTPPVTEPTPPVSEPTPPITQPTPPIIDPTGPVSPVPEPAAWALWLMGFGLIGGLIRWRRRAFDAVAAEDAGGDAA